MFVATALVAALIAAVLFGVWQSRPHRERAQRAPSAHPSEAVTSRAEEARAAPAAEPSSSRSEGEREGAPSNIRDESRLLAAGYVTRQSGLDGQLLEASFVEEAGATGASVTAMFLDAGYSPDSATSAGLTPLHCAALRGESDNVRLLLARGARVDARTWEHHLTA